MPYTLPMGAAWLVSALLVEAAIIDGRQLRVPNWLTFHLAAGGLAYWAWTAGWGGLGWSAAGMVVGFVPLMIVCAIGGMGAGDVKMFAGFGAWVGPLMAAEALAVSAIVGGIIALGMIAWSGEWRRHWSMGKHLAREIATVKHPDALAERAAERKPTMRLLPYGIPLAIGSIGYMAYHGLLM
jgi:prepilin peptidase CpaA